MLRHPRLQRLYIVCLIIAALILATFVFPGVVESQECSPPGPCEPPPDNPPPSDNNNQGGEWTGYSDGRLNPDMAEYYTIYCKNDLIEVWGGVPSPQLVNQIPIANVIALGYVGSFNAGDGMTVSRSGDTVVISGSNGNGSSPGSKVFNLSSCISANGGAPVLQAQPVIQPTPRPTATPDPYAEAKNDVQHCSDLTKSNVELVECLSYARGGNQSADYFYFISWVIGTICAGGMTPFALVASVPAIGLWRRRSKLRWRK